MQSMGLSYIGSYVDKNNILCKCLDDECWWLEALFNANNVHFAEKKKNKMVFNPLTPVPAITGCVKAHPQFPVPAVTGSKKAHEHNCLSFPAWRLFGSLIVLLLLTTNKPMTINFLSIFLEDFRGPRKTVFRLKIMHLKIPVFIQAFEHVISLFTTGQSGIWVWLLVISLGEPG